MRKKLVIFVFCLLTLNSFADYSIRLSYAFLNNEEIAGNSLQSGSYDINGEYFVEPLDNMALGFGIAYSWPAEFKNASKTINSNPIDSAIPIYGSILVKIFPESNIEPYLIGRLGYSVINSNKNSKATDVQGDLYKSIGVGGYFNNFLMELTYDETDGYYTLNSKRQDIDFSRFSLRIGYKFNFVKREEKTLHDDTRKVILPIKENNYDNYEEFNENGKKKKKKGEYEDIGSVQIID